MTSRLEREFGDLTMMVRTLASTRDVSPRSMDAIMAMGELASSHMVAAAFRGQGVPAVWIDSRLVLVTDDGAERLTGFTKELLTVE